MDDRVKFRVCKKLSKVLFINGGKKISKKKQCENFAKILEQQVRERSDDFASYKKSILSIIQQLEKQPEDIHLFLGYYQKERKNGIYQKKLEQYLNN